ncbi:MAG: hypothetical protein ABI634_03330 [Acidobacteriota bacterium]
MESRLSRVLLPLAGTALIVGLVVAIYSPSSTAFFFNDDYAWLSQSWEVDPRHFFDLSRYSHFYRPVIELYFGWGLHTFGCDPVPFHWLSVAIHLMTCGLVFLLAREIGMSRPFAYFAALWFAVQSGPVEAVAWIGAITDLMPGFWYILALWMFAAFLRRRRRMFYVATLAAFIICLLTHESSATLIAMLVAMDVILVPRGPVFTAEALGARLRWYAPFAVLVIGYLALAYVVNTRSYLVTEGHYRFGLHAGPKLLDYLVAILVWVRGPVQDIVLVAALGATLALGTPRMRFFVVWILITLLPVLFFTWGIAARYEYVPAAGVSLLIAELLQRWHAAEPRRIGSAVRNIGIALIALTLVVRSTHFARRGTADQLQMSQPFSAIKAAALSSARDAEGRVVLNAEVAALVPPEYLERVVQISLCQRDVRTVVH